MKQRACCLLATALNFELKCSIVKHDWLCLLFSLLNEVCTNSIHPPTHSPSPLPPSLPPSTPSLPPSLYSLPSTLSTPSPLSPPPPPRIRGEGSTLVQDRKYHLHAFKQCFIGRDFVDWLIAKGEASTRGDAVELGKHLLDAGVFRHGECCVVRNCFSNCIAHLSREL